MLTFLAGGVVCCGALLVLAGASKVYRGVRRIGGSTAIWRALRIPPRAARRGELAVGGVECVTGILVCIRMNPVASGIAMAALGVAFCALLGYVLISGVPGGCGCLSWRRSAGAAAQSVTWRAITRAGMLAAAGIADALAPGAGTGVFHQAGFYAGALAAAVVLMLLGAHHPVRTPACRRPLWRPVRAAARALTGHEAFAAMASAAGPLGPDVRYRRTGCTDEFWFPAAGSRDGKAVVFRVSYPTAGGALSVHASVRGGRAAQAVEPILSQRLRVVNRHQGRKTTDSRREKP